MLRAWLAALAVAAPLQCLALDRVSSDDLTQIRGVIHRQIDAFRRDDAHGAFALASPGVQEAFGTAERFLETVRAAYGAVYRPVTVTFLDLVVVGDDVVQPVQVIDRGGAVWVAYYGMQRQKDGSWRTNGCRLIQPNRTISA